jgi:hypothetical protein
LKGANVLERFEWKDEIVKCLAGLKLAPTREAQIAEELAQHQDDRYQELLARGATELNARPTAGGSPKNFECLGRALELNDAALLSKGEGTRRCRSSTLPPGDSIFMSSPIPSANRWPVRHQYDVHDAVIGQHPHASPQLTQHTVDQEPSLGYVVGLAKFIDLLAT